MDCEFDDLLDNISSENLTDSMDNISVVYQNVISPKSQASDSSGSLAVGSSKKLVDLENLTLVTPEKATILMALTFSIHEKDHLLITGPSGSGKTSLLRAMAGLWTSGSGEITFYMKDSDHLQPTDTTDDAEQTKTFKNRSSRGIFFLPQKPYMVLGTLRQQLLYPTWSEVPYLDSAQQNGCPLFLMPQDGSDSALARSRKPSTEDLYQVLEDVRLGYILPRFGLDSICEWSSILSLGEQQRLAFARLLLSKPYLILLDESTSALDEDNEAHLYGLIEAASVTYISIGHRRSLYKYHNKVLNIMKMDPQSSERNWNIKPINSELRSDLSELEL